VIAVGLINGVRVGTALVQDWRPSTCWYYRRYRMIHTNLC